MEKMTVDLERQLTLQQRLDDLAAELLARAVALDSLAAQIEADLIATKRREKEVRRRERDVLKASGELIDMRERLKRGEISYATG
jgi:FKBP-type peptidyl-prolyl cis-trans isomerase (trigger factor)